MQSTQAEIDGRDLRQLLCRLHDLFARLLELQRAKAAALVEGDVRNLTAISRRELALATEFKTAARDMAGPSLAALIAAAPPAEQPELQAMQTKLDRLARQTQELRDLNQTLLHTARSYTSFMLSLLTSEPKGRTCYAPTGRSAAGSPAQSLLNGRM